MSGMHHLADEIARLRAENAKLCELKTPATRQLLNITKGALDHAETECAKLRAALESINMPFDQTMTGLETANLLRAIARDALNEQKP